MTSGLLTPCQPDDPQEQARYVHYATLFRSDGEAMCLALGECRGWTVATDDRKGNQRRPAGGADAWSRVPNWSRRGRMRPDPIRRRLVQVLTDIQTLAQFRPNPTMPEADWWQAAILAHDPTRFYVKTMKRDVASHSSRTASHYSMGIKQQNPTSS